jgi:hypothetical protein
MAKKLLIILANSDPENPEEFSAPLFQAMVSGKHTKPVWFSRYVRQRWKCGAVN